MLAKRKGWLSVSVLLLVALALAACAGGPTNGGQPTGGAVGTEPGLAVTEPMATEPMATEPMATEPAAATEPVPETGGTEAATESGMDGEALGPVELEVANSPDLGDYLVDGDGMTLYLFTNDEPGVSNCSGGCLEAWPPFLVDSEDNITVGEGVDESLVGTIPFEGGGLLVTYDEWPLYYWQNDVEPGDTTGQGVNDVWFVVPPEGVDESAFPGGESSSDDSSMAGAQLNVANSAELGDYLVDGEGMTLYLFTNDEPGVSNCSGGCLEAWPPFLVDSEDGVSAGEGVDDSKIGTLPFEGGRFLVTYDQMPLYYWQNDAAPGDTTGQGVNDVWFVVPP